MSQAIQSSDGQTVGAKPAWRRIADLGFVAFLRVSTRRTIPCGGDDDVTIRLGALQARAEAAEADRDALRAALAQAEVDRDMANEALETGRAALGAERAAQATMKRAAAYDVASVVSACALGNFDRRVDLEDKGGLHLDFCEGLNAMSHAVDTGLASVHDALEMLARGDLSHRMGEAHHGVFLRIAASLDRTADVLDDMVTRLVRTGGTVSESSGRIATAMTDLVRRTDVAANTVDGVFRGLEGLTEFVSRTADITTRTKAQTGQAVEDVARGTDALDRSCAAMRDVQAASAEIAAMVSVIDDIAFQTNLLALNAGVEAARAGEHGRGFAVIATEVRALARRSAEAAGAITDIIRRSEAAVDAGVASVAGGVDALAVVSRTTDTIATEIDAVAEAATRQASEIAALRDAAGAIRATILSAAQAARTTGEATCALDAQSQELERLASVFTITADLGRFDLASSKRLSGASHEAA